MSKHVLEFGIGCLGFVQVQENLGRTQNLYAPVGSTWTAARQQIRHRRAS